MILLDIMDLLDSFLVIKLLCFVNLSEAVTYHWSVFTSWSSETDCLRLRQKEPDILRQPQGMNQSQQQFIVQTLPKGINIYHSPLWERGTKKHSSEIMFELLFIFPRSELWWIGQQF